MTFSPSRARQEADAASRFLTGAARTKNESSNFDFDAHDARFVNQISAFRFLAVSWRTPRQKTN